MGYFGAVDKLGGLHGFHHRFLGRYHDCDHGCFFGKCYHEHGLWHPSRAGDEHERCCDWRER